jgi:hypothetical protein
MTADWFDNWVQFHQAVTGSRSNPDVAAVLVSNRAVILETWQATEAEMRSASRRLVAYLRTPKWANEHLDALGRELLRMRGEESQAASPPPGDFSTCGTCGGAKMVVVPHPLCVDRGRLVCWRGRLGIRTVAVFCDECPAGRAAALEDGRRFHSLPKARQQAQPVRPTLTAYTRKVGCDAVTLLRELDKFRAEQSRDLVGLGPLADQFPNLAKIVTG